MSRSAPTSGDREDAMYRSRATPDAESANGSIHIPRNAEWNRRPSSARPAPAATTSTETVLLLIQALCVAGILVFMAATFRVGEAAYIAFALMGAFGIHLATRPTRRELLLTLASAAVFAGIYFLLHGKVGDYWGRTIGVAGGFLGMGSLLLLSCKWIFAPPAAKRSHFEVLREASLIPLLCICSIAAVALAIRFTPLTYDRLLYAVDYKFGGPPSWVIGRLFRAHASLFLACAYAYNSLPLGMVACMWLRWRDRQNRVHETADLLWMAVSLGIVGFLLYQVCPAAGPIYLFPKQFPYAVPSVVGLATSPAPMQAVPRNAMPSLHVAWMLLLFWNTRNRAWWIRLLATAYLVLTALATLGLGEHYLADLIVAPPLVVAIQAACTRSAARERWIACLTGAVITLSWLIAFRTGAAMMVPRGAAIWSLAAVSLLVPMAAGWRLERATQADAAGRSA